MATYYRLHENVLQIFTFFLILAPLHRNPYGMTEKVWEGTVRMILCQGLKIVIEISPVLARLYLGQIGV